MFDLFGRVAVVTGASSGLGKAMAMALAKQGANVAVMARRMERLEELHGIIEREYGVRCLPVQCDVTSEESVVAAAKLVEIELGPTDILINNAGHGKTSPIESTELSQWNAEFDVDVNGAFLCTREFGKQMLAKKYGRIINIASMYGLVGNTAIPSSAYHAAKGAVINFTRAVAAEWAQHGVLANCICPGYFATEMTEGALGMESFIQYIQAHVPLGRYAQAEEICGAAVFLASDEASYVTGSILSVDGGYTAV